ncbi:MAG: endolytic transglycosylase MltG [Candidatus Gracilibacteria bacterium]
MNISFKNKKVKVIGLGAIIILALIFDNIGYKSFLNKPLDTTDTAKTAFFVIKSGESAKTVSNNLKDKELISNSRYFYKYMASESKDTKIVAGAFKLSASMTPIEIANTITDPSKSQYVLTVREGLLVRDIDKKLTDMELIKLGDFITATRNFKDYADYDFLDKNTLTKLNIPLEGYLFPDTYFLNPANFSSDSLIKRMLGNFKNKLTPKMLNDIKTSKRTLHEIITMASILEKEGRKQDFEMVSGILWKRFDNKWALDADAAILYITGKNTISSEDLRMDSPYNVRKNRGLPPGPISNPGLNAIMASIYPKSSKYWFYLTSSKTNEMVYSATNEEHNINRAKHL